MDLLFSGPDAAGTRRLLQSLRSSCPGRTTIVIDHDPIAAALIARPLDAANCRRLTPAAIATAG
jgi:hypothetical protein